jgi:hypothetical protein
VKAVFSWRHQIGHFLGRWEALTIFLACLSMQVNSAPLPERDNQRADARQITFEKGFPRLLGMNIAREVQDEEYRRQMARLDVVIIGFFPGWNKLKTDDPIGDAVRSIQASNLSILVGNYTILSEANADIPKYAMFKDKAFKLAKENWWLKNAEDQKVQWTGRYDAWETNFSDWAKPDFNGDRYPQWLAKRDYRLFFEPVPQFGIWYFDNVGAQPGVTADWDMDGKDDLPSDPKIARTYRLGHVAEWAQARALRPDILLMGNVSHDLDFPEYRGQLNGAFLEGLMGKSWSLERWSGWRKMMERYHRVFENLAPPRMVGFNVAGDISNYRFFRYAFTSCLMDDGYFSYTDEKVGYSSVPWFDEYDIRLGKAIDPPQTAAWRADIFRREFENGLVLLNPTGLAKKVKLEPGWKRFMGKQAPEVNNGMGVNEITVQPKDGIVLVRQ